MFCTGKGAIPMVFQSMFKRVTHPYYTLFRKSKFRERVTFVGHKLTSSSASLLGMSGSSVVTS